jgi:hypothetical protein
VINTPGNGSRLGRTQVETSARREVRRTNETMAAEFDGRTIAHLRSNGLTWPGFKPVAPEPIAQM